MSWLSDAFSNVSNALPNSGGNVINPLIGLGIGAPIVNMNKPENPFQAFADLSRGINQDTNGIFSKPSQYLNDRIGGGARINLNPSHQNWSFGADPNTETPEESQRRRQRDAKMDAGFLAETDPAANQKYLRYLNDQYMTGFVNDPNAYEGISDAANTAARAEKIAQRNSTQTGQVNARLGKMGATKGADSLRMALENSLQNQQDLSYNDAQGAYNEWNSKVKQQMDNLANREKLGANAVQAQAGRATDMAHGWQGQIGEVGAGLIDAYAGGASVPGLVMQGYKYGMPVLAKQDSALRQALGNPAIDAANYMLNPNVSVRGLQKKVNEQGNDNSKEASKRLLIDTGY